MDLLKSEDGRYSEGRIFAIIGKLVVIWLLIDFGSEVIEKEWILLILVSTLIAPKLFEKILYMRAGGKSV